MTKSTVTTPPTSRAWWFLGTLAVLRNPDGSPRTPTVIELTVPQGGSPPLHVHHELDDAFLLLEGELVVRCGEERFVATPGSYVVVPAGTEHTFRVMSSAPARLLLVHNDDSFLELIEAAGTPTEERRLPPSGDFDLDLDALVRLNAEHDSQIVGPSLEEDEARSVLATNYGSPLLGALHHLAITVTDLRRSAAWYSNAFGLIRVDGEIAPDGNGHVTLLSPSGGWIVALQSASSGGVEHAAIACQDRNDLLAWRELLLERSAAPGTVTDAAYGSGFVVRDPDGTEIELFASAAR